MKVLVIGGGGREHAIVDALSRSPQVEKIYCAPGNAGIARQAECVAIRETEVERLRDFAAERGIGLTVVGPEVALAAGVVDCFRAAGLRIFGPTKAAARIESSKEFAKRLMAKYAIPTAGFRAFNDYAGALAYVQGRPLPAVLKYDGLAGARWSSRITSKVPSFRSCASFRDTRCGRWRWRRTTNGPTTAMRVPIRAVWAPIRPCRS